MTCRHKHYLQSSSEHLVLEGYRYWCSGVISGDYSHWKNAWNLFAVKLGTQEGRLALGALTRFTKTLGMCAACPLKTSTIGCNSLCRDEVLILGLLSGLQHDDATAVTLCLEELVCNKKSAEVLHDAEILATTLRALNEYLLPVPVNTIRTILTDAVSNGTLH